MTDPRIPIRTVLLDMDGVLTHFIDAALRAHGKRPEPILEAWPRGVFGAHTILGIDIGAFWVPINRLGEAFWRTLPPFPWTRDLLDWAETVPAHWAICTSPSRDPACPRGKMEWLYAHVRPAFRDVALTPKKHLLARPDVVLVDDTERMCERFEAEGGHAVLFPQYWNRRGAVADPWGLVKAELEARFHFPPAAAFAKKVTIASQKVKTTP